MTKNACIMNKTNQNNSTEKQSVDKCAAMLCEITVEKIGCKELLEK